MSHTKDIMTIIKRHQEICDGIHDMWLHKNTEYGDSFHQLYADLGIISAVTQITHKYNRLKNLAKNRNTRSITIENESIIDTLLDMANYCIMTAMEIEREDITISNPECFTNKEDK